MHMLSLSIRISHAGKCSILHTCEVANLLALYQAYCNPVHLPILVGELYDMFPDLSTLLGQGGRCGQRTRHVPIQLREAGATSRSTMTPAMTWYERLGFSMIPYRLPSFFPQSSFFCFASRLRCSGLRAPTHVLATAAVSCFSWMRDCGESR